MNATAPIWFRIVVAFSVLIVWTCANECAPLSYDKTGDVGSHQGGMFRGELDCADSIEASCDFFTVGSNASGASNVTFYNCAPNVWESGPEVVYELTLSQGAEVMIVMTPDGCDLDLFLLASCDENDCLQGSFTVFTEQITRCVSAGTYYIVIDGFNGAICPFDITISCTDCPTSVDPYDVMPERFALHPCSPNPFNPYTTIRFDLPKPSQVSLKIFDISGRCVRLFDYDHQPAGLHTLIWNGLDDSGRELSTGVYFYELRVNGELVGTEKAVIVR
jgi:hypothetical protein